MSNRHLWFNRLCRVLNDMPDDVEVHVSSGGTITWGKPGTLMKVADANHGSLGGGLENASEGTDRFPRLIGWSGD